MKFTFKHADKVVSVFFIIAVFVIILATIFILINQKFFIKKHYFRTEFSDRQGLKVNSDIYFNGFSIGKLVSFSLNEKDTVDVKLYIYDEYINRITQGSVLNRMSNPITGSTVFLLRNYNSTALIPENGFIPSLDTEEGKRLVEYGIIKTKGDNINNIINNVDRLLASLNSDRNPEANSIARILVNTADIIEKLKKDLDSVDYMLVNINDMLNNFKNLSYTMRDAEGLVQKMVDPDGKYMFNSLQKSLEELANTMENLNKFTKFINSQQKEIEILMYDSKKTIDDTQKVLEGLKNNPLLKGGITNKKDSVPSTVNTREMDIK